MEKGNVLARLPVVVPSYRRPLTMRTPDLDAFAGRTLILVHDREDLDAYKRAGWLDRGARIMMTNVPPGPGGKMRQVRWYVEMCTDPGDWTTVADDDMYRLTAVETGWYDLDALPVTSEFVGSDSARDWRRLFETPVPPDRWDAIRAETIRRAESIGAHLVGFASNKNPFYRGRKWREVGYVEGGLVLRRTDPNYRWPEGIGMEDFAETAEHLRRYGSVLLNNFLYGYIRNYSPGGMGSREDRREQRLADVLTLMETYPGLFRTFEKADGWLDLRLRFVHAWQVERWRAGG